MSNAFVRRSGSQLLLDSQPFRFVSFNVPNLHYLEDLPTGRTFPIEYEQVDALTSISMFGGRVTRTYVLGVVKSGSTTEYGHFARILPGTDVRPPGQWVPVNGTDAIFANEELFRALDNAIAISGRLGVRLIIPFIDNWSYWGGIKEFAGYFGASTSQSFYTDMRTRDAFKAVIAHVLMRNNTVTGVTYRDDPTILAWETGNELQSDAGRVPTSWTTDIAATVKSLDTKHILVDGSFSLNGWDPAVLGDANIDAFTGHYYPIPFDVGGTVSGTGIPFLLGALLSLICTILLIIICVRPARLKFLREKPPATKKTENTLVSTEQSPTVSTARKRFVTIVLSCLLVVSVAVLAYGLYKVASTAMTYLNPNYGKRFLADNALVSSFNKTFFVGEFGTSTLEDYTGLLDSVLSSSAAGAMIWSLRFHSRNGGFYTHTETASVAAFHYPGFPSGSGFASDEVAAVSLIRKYAALITSQNAPLSTPPTIKPQLLNTSSLGGGLIWRGTSGASSYVVERSLTGANGTFLVVSNATVDGKKEGSPLFVDTSLGGVKEAWYRVSGVNEAGRTSASEVLRIE